MVRRLVGRAAVRIWIRFRKRWGREGGKEGIGDEWCYLVGMTGRGCDQECEGR